jgi:hypothetical protein
MAEKEDEVEKEIHLDAETGEVVDPPEEKDEDEEQDESVETKAEDDAAEDDSEREAIRERRRQERHERKAKQREREDTLKRELASRDELLEQMRQRLDAVERKNQGTDVAQIDVAMKQTSDAYAYFKGQIDVATRSQDGAALADATEKMIIARQKYQQLEQIKQRVAQANNAPPPLDPRLKQNAETWMSKHKWFDPRGNDSDSRIVSDEDDRLSREGWNPNTEEYWNELTSRIKKRLPHKFSSYNKTNTRPPSPVGGSGRESGGGGAGRETVKISPERVAAMKEIGVWDNPKARAEMIKEYKKYDAEQRRAN